MVFINYISSMADPGISEGGRGTTNYKHIELFLNALF